MDSFVILRSTVGCLNAALLLTVAGCVASERDGDVASDRQSLAEDSPALLEEHASDAVTDPDDVNWEYPIEVVELPNGNVLHFFVSEIDGGSGVIEYGEGSSGSVLGIPELQEASALEIFLAVTSEDEEIPSELLRTNVIDPSAAIAFARTPVTDAGSFSRGWVLDAFATTSDASAVPQADADGPDAISSKPRVSLWASWCDSAAAFGDEFFDTDATYTTWWGFSSTTEFRSNNRKAVNWRGGQCAVTSSFTAVMGWFTLDGSCTTGNFDTYVWLEEMYAGGWFSYTFNGTNRHWDHYRYPGGTGRIGNKWKAATCL